ncbi:MAG: hypothetical protein GY835_03395 [bacterium]|nr:hypothetical protein [bacterium]
MKLRDLFTNWLESFELWQEQVFDDPANSLTIASEMRSQSEILCRLLQGRSFLAYGASCFHTGDLDTAEQCFKGAELILHDHSIEQAEAKRNLAAIRAKQGSKFEALRLLKESEQLLTEAPPSERGKVQVQTGAVYERFQEYRKAVDCYLSACRYLEKSDRHYIIALNNCLHVLIKLQRTYGPATTDDISIIAEEIETLRKRLSPRSAITTLVDWLRLISAICRGNYQHAIRNLPKINQRLRKAEYPEAAYGLVEIDLAQAYFLANQKGAALDALRRAADYLGHVADEIYSHVEMIKSGNNVEPWDLRHLANFSGGPSVRTKRPHPEVTRIVTETVRALLPRTIPFIPRSDSANRQD